MQQKQKLFARGGLLILKDKSSNIVRSLFTSLCKIHQEQGMSCPKLAQTEYKKRHDVVGRVIHWELCKEYGVECSDKWYEHSPKSIAENEEVMRAWTN